MIIYAKPDRYNIIIIVLAVRDNRFFTRLTCTIIVPNTWWCYQIYEIIWYLILLDFRTTNLWRVTFCVHTFSVRSAAFGEERRSDRRRDGFDVWRMAVASVSQGSHLAGTVHQEQMRRRFDHSTTRHYRRPLSTRVNIKSYVMLYNIIIYVI